MAYGSEIVAKLGLNTEGFTNSLAKARSSVDVFAEDAGKVLRKKFEFKDLFKGVAQGLGILGVQEIAERIVAPFKEAAEWAQKIAESSERQLNALRQVISLRQTEAQQLQTLQKELRDLQKEGAGIGSSRPGFFDSFIGTLKTGSMAGGMEAFKRERDAALAENAAKQEELFARIEAKRKAIEDKAAAERKQREEKEAADREAAAREIAQLDARREESAKKRAEFEREESLARMSSEERLVSLTKERADKQSELNTLLAAEKDGITLTAEGNSRVVELKKQIADIQKQITDETEKTADAEKRARTEAEKAAAIKKQLSELNSRIASDFVFQQQTGYSLAELQNASDEAIGEIIRRARKKLDLMPADPATPISFGNSLEVNRTRNIIARAEQEKNFREQFRFDLQVLGKERARENFAGDPLAYDRLLERFRDTFSGLTEQQELQRRTAEGIDKLNRLFELGGARVRATDETPRNPRT